MLFCSCNLFALRKPWTVDALALIPLIWVAHPLGVICLAALAAYVMLSDSVQPRKHGYVLLAAGVFLLGVRTFLARDYDVKWNGRARYFFFNGADQLALYSSRYYVVYALLAAVFLAALATDAIGRQGDGGFWESFTIPLQLYLATSMALFLLPTSINFPQYAEPLSYLTPRLSSISAILACWMLGAIKSKNWHVIGYALIAILFFTFLYTDTGIVNRMEDQVERSVEVLPPGHRVVGEIDFGEDSRVGTEHILDRACIGRCFSYENYEPSSGAFRVRASPGNSFVTASLPDEFDSLSTEHLVNALNPPVFEIFQCDANPVNICARGLSAEEIKELIEGDFNP